MSVGERFYNYNNGKRKPNINSTRSGSSISFYLIKNTGKIVKREKKVIIKDC